MIKNNITVRKLKLTDNLSKVAELIYKTDPYIYPYWFKNYKDWNETLVELIKTEGSIFNHNDIIIALKENNIVGILVYLTSSTNLSFNYCELTKVNKNFNYTINKYINKINDNIKPNDLYIPNICVDEHNRNLKIGTNLINHIKNLYPTHTLTLHCLKNNKPALNLYIKNNFKIVKKLKGFNSPLKFKPSIYEMSYSNNAK